MRFAATAVTASAGMLLAALVVPSAEAASAPAGPRQLTLESEAVDFVGLSFVDGSTNETSFRVERSGPGGAFETVWTSSSANPAGTGRVYRLTAPKVGALDCYRARSVNSSGEGSTSMCIGPARQTRFDFVIQRPYDVPVNQRYAYEAASNIHTTRVFATDKPHDPASTTDPRTEMSWQHTYSTGQHMWQADLFVPNGTGGTLGTTIMQIFRRNQPDGAEVTDLMLNVDSSNPRGRLRLYRPIPKGTLATGIYDRWFNLKVVHDTERGLIYVYLDNELVKTVADQGPAGRHFKNGVYHHDEVGQSVVQFRNLGYWVR